MKELMTISFDEKGTFVERKNRFLGSVRFKSGELDDVHVRDPGRLKDLLYEGNEVLLKKADNENRKTDWDLISAKFYDLWVLVNSGYHRKITKTILEDESISPFDKIDSFKPEAKLGDSRIDFLIKKNGKKIWTEVKGCTLAKNGEALFPDAPTARGKRHVDELREAVKNGDRGALLILIFRSDAECFRPYEKRDPDFSDSFYNAYEEGVEVHPLLLSYNVDGKGKLYFKKKIPLCHE
ncbi:MAG: DNA/RNA nuclease SfsA [Thermoplasmatota archaeon]